MTESPKRTKCLQFFEFFLLFHSKVEISMTPWMVIGDNAKIVIMKKSRPFYVQLVLKIQLFFDNSFSEVLILFIFSQFSRSMSSFPKFSSIFFEVLFNFLRVLFNFFEVFFFDVNVFEVLFNVFKVLSFDVTVFEVLSFDVTG